MYSFVHLYSLPEVYLDVGRIDPVGHPGQGGESVVGDSDGQGLHLHRPVNRSWVFLKRLFQLAF